MTLEQKLKDIIVSKSYNYDIPYHRNCFGCCQNDSDYEKAFIAGANLLLPLLLKAIEQRDDITEQFWDGVVPNYIIEANNQELLEALNDQAK